MLKTKKALKITVLALIALIFCACLIFIGIYGFFYFSSDLSIFKLNQSQQSLKIYDKNNKLITDQIYGIDYLPISAIPSHVIDAFVCQEDKRFFSHKGIDLKRMAKAALVNMKNNRAVQGASTISQQLIKNTHLNNQKTLTRKLKEIALTRKMEKKLTKEEILERYLNIIYFGNNCYGISNAARFYFDKSATKLTIDEAASLVAIITAPSRLSPTNSLEKNHAKRNQVLSSMLLQNKLSKEEFEKISQSTTTFKFQTNLMQSNSYTQSVISQVARELGISKGALLSSGYKVYTQYDPEKQKIFNEIYQQNKDQISDNDFALLSINKITKGVDAYLGKSQFNLSSLRRQPGSTIKPVLVYAPALEEKRITPATHILDQQIDINGYKPENVNKKYSGYVSVRECVSRSLNIPAVKVLSYTGIEKSKHYAQNMGIKFNEKDVGYSLALGGMTDGTTLCEITNAYIPFINNGNYFQANYYSYVTNYDGKIILKSNDEEKSAISDSTAYLTYDMLKTGAKYGTAKKLSSLDFEIAAKTGTVGNSQRNTDAYCITCTSEGVLSCWIGNTSNNNIKISGGGLPTAIAKSCNEKIYLSHKPQSVKIPSSVITKKIDILSLKEDNVLKLANDFTPDRYITNEIFSVDNYPTELSDNFCNIDDVVLQCKNDGTKHFISFQAKDYITYEIIAITNNTEKIVETLSNTSGIHTFQAPSNCEQIFVRAKIKKFADDVQIISKDSNVIKLISDKTKSIVNDNKWYL